MAAKNLAQGWQVLIVDDQPDNLVVLKLAMQRQGAEVYAAANGIEALEMLAEVVPTVILLDLSMPQMNGWEFFEHVRSHESMMHVPIIAVTAHTSQHARSTAEQMGFDGYITKPINPLTLVETIRDIMENTRQQF